MLNFNFTPLFKFLFISLAVAMIEVAAQSMSVRQLISVFPKAGDEEADSAHLLEMNGELLGEFKGRSTVRIKTEPRSLWVTQRVDLSSRKSQLKGNSGWTQVGDQFRWCNSSSLALNDSSRELRIPLNISEENKIFFNRDATEVWVDYQDVFSPNTVRVGIESVLKGMKKYGMASQKVYFCGASNVGGKIEFQIGNKSWVKNGILYHLRKYLRLNPLDSWNYARSGGGIILQNTMRVRVSDCKKLELFFDPNTPIRRISARIINKGSFRGEKLIEICHPSSAMLQKGVVAIDLERCVQELLSERPPHLIRGSYLQELIIQMGGEPGDATGDWILKKKPIHDLVVTFKDPVSGTIFGLPVESLPSRIDRLPSGRKRLVVDIRPLYRRYHDIDLGSASIVITPEDSQEISFFQVDKVHLAGDRQGSVPLFLGAGYSSTLRWGGPFLGLGNGAEKMEWPFIEAYFPDRKSVV